MDTIRSNWKPFVLVGVSIPVVSFAGYFVWDRFFKSPTSDEYLRTDCAVTSVEMSVPSARVGSVIGKKGSVLRQIENDCKVLLHFKHRNRDQTAWKEEDDDEDEKLTIKGHWDNIKFAQIAIQRIIDANTPCLNVDVFVPKGSIGFIIGKGGDSIREIRCGCSVQIEIGNTGVDPERITISGTGTGIEQAKVMIADRVEQFKDRQNAEIERQNAAFKSAESEQWT